MSQSGVFGHLGMMSKMQGRLVVVLLAVIAGGCSFSRTVTNGFVRQMDTSWIEPGKTTREDIVNRLGYPPAMTGIKGERGGTSGAIGTLMGQDGGHPAIGMDTEAESVGSAQSVFRWYCGDSNRKMFEGGWFVYPTFSRQRQQRGHDIYILFDEKGVVKLLSRTELRDGCVRLLEWKELPR